MTTRTQPIVRDVFIEKRIVPEECPVCSVDYGLGEVFLKQRREDHATWYCPNGHPSWFPPGTSEAEKAIKERDAARELARREAQRRQRAEQEARTAEYQRRAAKGQLTKLRNRIANGVCPCCNRSFANVRRHIADQHPEFVVPEVSA